MKRDLVLAAAEMDLPPCPRCSAAQGDPCRSPSQRTMRPHRARLSRADRAAVEHFKRLRHLGGTAIHGRG